jgi:regulator of RNase E activity RraA
MKSDDLSRAFSRLSTPLVFDACLRAGLPPRTAPPGIRSLPPKARIAGRALPARHYGSVDVFLDAIQGSSSGDVLVVDNRGRQDEGCVGDLIALEAQAVGLAGIVIWGFHRDTADVLEIGLPVFSYGACLMGPQRLDPREPDALTSARLGEISVGRADIILADDDGVIVVPDDGFDALLSVAHGIREKERAQATAIKKGKSLREQLGFEEYRRLRDKDPAYSFRDHLRAIDGAIEE